MKRLCLFSAWFGFASYCALSLVSGSSGLEAERLLRERIGSMAENLESLARTNAQLAAEWKSSSGEAASIAIEARSIGYLSPDEVAVRLPFVAAPRHPAPGETILALDDYGMSDEGIKKTALILALSVFGAGMALKAVRRKQDARGH